METERIHGIRMVVKIYGIGQTDKSFLQEGVDLDSLSDRHPRPRTPLTVPGALPLIKYRFQPVWQSERPVHRILITAVKSDIPDRCTRGMRLVGRFHMSFSHPLRSEIGLTI
jgi:hypothetical protein